MFGVAHECQVEAILSDIFQPGKFDFKEWGDCIGARGAVFGAEIEIMAIPLRVNIDNVIVLIFIWSRRRLNVLWI